MVVSLPGLGDLASGRLGFGLMTELNTEDTGSGAEGSLTPGPASLPRAPGTLLNALLDLASNSLTVSLTRDLGLGGTTGFTGDLSGGLCACAPGADFAL